MPDGNSVNRNSFDWSNNVHVLLSQPAWLTTFQQLEVLAEDGRVSEAMRRAARRELTRAEARRREAQSRSGVCWSGMGDDPYVIRSVAQIAEEARQEEERMRSPRARFFKYLKGVQELPGYEAQAEALRAHFCRELADERDTLNVAAVGAAVAMLNEIPGSDARGCMDCLADLLLSQGRAAR